MAHTRYFAPAGNRAFDLAGIRSNPDAGLLKRVLLTLAVACGLLVLFAPDANATPIHPDIRTMVTQPQQDAPQYAPARAGWDGPEVQRVQSAARPLEEQQAALARAERAELVAAATPDPGIVLGIAALILLLRVLRRREENRQAVARDVPALQAGGGLAA